MAACLSFWRAEFIKAVLSQMKQLNVYPGEYGKVPFMMCRPKYSVEMQICQNIFEFNYTPLHIYGNAMVLLLLEIHPAEK